MTTYDSEKVITDEDLEVFRQLHSMLPKGADTVDSVLWVSAHRDIVIPMMRRSKDIVLRIKDADDAPDEAMAVLGRLVQLMMRLADLLDSAGVPLPDDMI